MSHDNKPAAAQGEIPESVLDAVAAAIGSGVYYCNRTWSAWSYGTMGPGDFHPVADDGDHVAEIAQAAIAAMQEHAPVAAAPVDGDFDGASYKRMFIDACSALAEVSRELGVDPEQGGAEPILAAIAKLKASAPAAPGNDLEGWAFERPSGADVIVISAPNGNTWIAEPDDRLHMLAAAVIDASPKGGSDERARFESWAEKHRRLSCPGYLARHALSGAYCIQVTDTAWDAWQAAKQATSAEVGS
ncbi:hypothetical protein ATCM_02880 [Stenotrophomonas sp. ATCM1_4]|uniref:hypothetical protein n=1 Tax=Stenotrophomonas sp. ATCM1_4 TaxID=2259330 RepID=UPI0010501ADA|nr:hypothetical protein [Stenotrophomonas sp. ATCM1_4]TDB26682.1 hypothetical protein ATCM_02880 [Stenotrophomonas sp. ATCM1_4]